ncbi:hypothetical protein X943_001636 [Babesia divergens]|uniref:Uncharacterized protein n=1 Tax=Babesia divergens TaxID=32595 RepID=A0AAD9LJ09_BABDI|nr:hypothetical protein X943_001636 [Babesia divergens]
MVTANRDSVEEDGRHNIGKSLHANEPSIIDLLPQLENGCQVRDILFDEVSEALQDNSRLARKLEALVVLRKSLNAHRGGINHKGAVGKILTKDDTDKLVTKDTIEECVVTPLKTGVFISDNAVKCECAKILFSTTSYLDTDVCVALFDTDTLRSLLLLVEYSAGNRGNTYIEEEIWVATVSIFRNLLMIIEIPFDISRQLLNFVCNKYDCVAVDFCHAFITKVILPKIAQNPAAGTYLVQSGHHMHMCRKATTYLASVVANVRDYAILSKVCATLVSISEHKFGIDLLLETNCINDVMRLALSVVSRYELMLKDQGLYYHGKDMTMREHITPQNHQLSFEALSVISKVAFTAHRRQISALLDLGVAEVLVKVLNCPLSSTLVRTRSANTLGNLGCESETEVQVIIDADAFPILVRTFQEFTEQNTRVEAAYAICACASKANRSQVGYIISCTSRSDPLGSNTCMALLCDMMDFVCKSDPCNEGNLRLCRVVLNALDNILAIGVRESKIHKLPENPYGRLFIEHQGDVKLAKITAFPDYHIATRATQISRIFFNRPRLWNSVNLEAVYNI